MDEIRMLLRQSPRVERVAEVQTPAEERVDKGKAGVSSFSITMGERGVGNLTRKLELPLFDGENPNGWVFRA